MRNKTRSHSKLVWLLTFLTFLFLARVSLQLIEYFVDLPGIPNFEKWQSGTLPYWLLFLFQIIILYLMGSTCLRAFKGSFHPSKARRKFFLYFGLIYFLAMVIRNILGLSVLSDSIFFTSFISIFFHYVLALFLMILSQLNT